MTSNDIKDLYQTICTERCDLELFDKSKFTELCKLKSSLDVKLEAVQAQMHSIESEISIDPSKSVPIINQICTKLNYVSSGWKNIVVNLSPLSRVIEHINDNEKIDEQLQLIECFLESFEASNNGIITESSCNLPAADQATQRLLKMEQLKECKNNLLSLKNQLTQSLTVQCSIKHDTRDLVKGYLKNMLDRLMKCEWTTNSLLGQLESVNNEAVNRKPVKNFINTIKNCFLVYERCTADEKSVKGRRPSLQLLTTNDLFLKELNLKLKVCYCFLDLVLSLN